MKKGLIIFSLILIVFLMGCQPVQETPKPYETPEPIPETTPEPIVVEPAKNPIEFALYDGTTLYYYDGVEITEAYQGWIRPAGTRKLSVGNVLNYFDEFGNVEYSRWISFEPDFIEAIPSLSKADVQYQDDIYLIETIEPEDAYAMGGRYKYYSVIYIDGIMQGNWFDNMWNTTDVITTANNFILAIDENGAYHQINGSTNVWKAYDDGLAFYNFDWVERNVTIADENGERNEQYGSNWFNGCRWQNADGRWYASHGYEWTYAEGLKENCNIMKTMQDQQQYPVWFQLGWTEYASIVPCGVRQENGEKVLYWIEANKGTLFKQIPSINQLQYVSRIYLGEGTRIYGSNQVLKLKPQWTNDKIYFHHENVIKRHDPVTGNTEIFSEEMELIPWN